MIRSAGLSRPARLTPPAGARRLRLWRSAALPATFGALVLFLALPLFAPGFPDSPDGPVHLFRVVHLDLALRQGEIYPRWLPELFGGYGFPLLNYYAPLFYYVAEGVRALGFGVLPAVKLALVAQTLLAAVGAYLLAADAFDRRAGLVAAVAYVCAPYYAMTTIHQGGFPQDLALSLLPLTLWAYRRAILRRWAGGWLLGAVLLAGVVLAHNITAMLFAPVLAGYVLLLLAGARSLRATALAFGSSLLAAGLSAFFWLPALVERDLARTGALTGGDFDFRKHFIPFEHLYALPPVLDRASANPQFAFTIGPVHLGLAAVALVGAILARRLGGLRRAEIGFCLLLVAAAGFLTQRASTPIWEAVPFLPYVEHPWRLLGVQMVGSSFLAAAAVYLLGRLRRAGSLAAAAIAVALVVATVPLLYPGKYQPYADVTLADALAWERWSGAWGTTSAAEFLPATVRKLPPLGEPPALLRLPGGARLLQAERQATRQRYEVDSPAPATVTAGTFYFPGWRGFVDGAETAVWPSDPEGLIELAVPAGAHRVELRLTDTPIRGTATWLSVAAFVLLVLLAIWTRWRPAAAVRLKVASADQPSIGTTPIALALAGLLVAKVLAIDPATDWFSFVSPGDAIRGMGQAAGVVFDGVVRLAGYTATLDGWQPGEARPIALYWRRQGPTAPPDDYAVAVHLVDERWQSWGQHDQTHPDGHPTSRWDERYIRAVHSPSLAANAPPGRYFVTVCVYHRQGGQCSPFERAGEPGLDQTYRLASFNVPQRPLDPAAISVRRDVPFEEGIVLVGTGAAPPTARAGEPLPVRLYWSTRRTIGRDYTVFVHLTRADGSPVAQSDGEPQDGRYHTTIWRPAEIVAETRTIGIPADLQAGVYDLRVGLYDGKTGLRLKLPGGEDVLRLGQIAVAGAG